MSLTEKEPVSEGPAAEGTGRLELIRRLVVQFGVEAQERAATVADFVRLVGLERDFEGKEEVLRRIEVRWVATSETVSGQ
jgi:hypothetical protein